MSIPTVFVVCPIGAANSEQRKFSDRLLMNVIAPVMVELNYSVIRGDQIPNPGRINDQIDLELRRADIVIADLRDLNPNVMYELGVRQGLRRSSILMAPEGQSLPFDLQDYRTIFYPRNLDIVDDIKHQLKLQVQAELGKSLEGSEHSWLHKEEEIVKIEENVECTAIWVITPDLYHTTNYPILRDVVQKNLQRDITYTFIFPKTEETAALLDLVRQSFSSHPTQLVERPMPDEDFRKMAVSHCLVFGPDVCSGRPRVFLELPINSREYWIEVGSDAAQGFLSRFYRIAKGLEEEPRPAS